MFLGRCNPVVSTCYARLDLIEHAEQIRSALDAVLASPQFASKRRGELLQYLVERTLSPEAGPITEYGIALDVFRKPETFDPATKSTVRAEMNRMRKALAEYYASGGAGDAWRFEFPLRDYAPTFVDARVPPPPVQRPQWIWLPVALAVLVVSGLAWRILAPGQPLVKSVIVLPFANLTGDPSYDYLSDGLTESLTDSLAHIASLRVVARTSAFQFRGKAADIRQIGRAVNADAVIEGSLRTNEGRLRVTVQLNRAADGYHILSRVFEGGPHDVLRLERDMEPPVMAALRPEFHAPGGRVPDPEAQELILRARTLRGYGAREQFDRALDLARQAVQKDPEYAGAWSELANIYAGATTNGFVDEIGAATQAKAAAARAIALDPNSAEAYTAEGYVDAMIFLNWKPGEAELRKALRLMPQSPLIHQRLGLVLMAQGHFDAALTEAKAAADLDPLIPNMEAVIGMVYFMQRRYGDAMREWKRVASLHPDATAILPLIGMAMEAQKDYTGAEKQFDAVRASNPLEADMDMAYLLAVSGRKAEARILLNKLIAAHPEVAFDLAVAYGALGDRDSAFKWLEQAWQRRVCYTLKVHPFLDPLRGDPRYAELLKRAGFEQ